MHCVMNDFAEKPKKERLRLCTPQANSPPLAAQHPSVWLRAVAQGLSRQLAIGPSTTSSNARTKSLTRLTGNARRYAKHARTVPKASACTPTTGRFVQHENQTPVGSERRDPYCSANARPLFALQR